MVAAIFLMIIIMAAIVVMARLSVTVFAFNTMGIQGARAYHAARAGLEWARYRTSRDNACFANTTIPLGGSLSGMTVNVQCGVLGNFQEGATTVNVYSITASASTTGLSPGHPEYAWRSLSATIWARPP